MESQMTLQDQRISRPRSKVASWLAKSGLAVFVLALAGTAAQASDIGVLRIQNNSNATQTFIVIDDYYRCMDFPSPLTDSARTTIIIAANSHTDTRFARDGRCDPEGRFLIMALDRQSGQPMSNAIAFETNAEANLTRIWEAESPTSYAQGLTSIGRDYASGSLTYVLETNLPGYTLGVAEGRWTLGCAGGQGCTQTLFSSVENTVSSEASTSKEVMDAFSATVSTGFEFGGASGEAEFTASTSTTTSEALTLASSGTTGNASECETAIDMTQYQISSVWQWTIQAQVGNGRVATTTCQVTCTPTGAPPAYLPGAPEAINACLVPRTDETQIAAVQAARDEQTAAAQRASAQRAEDAALAAAAQLRAASCVTFFTGPNGTGAAATVCGTDQSSWTGNSVEYANLGTPGTNSHHYSVQSFRCAPEGGYVQFINGNANPWTRHNESCRGGAMVTPNPWVEANATGAGIYASPARCCGE
jgi:hypothetical protein